MSETEIQVGQTWKAVPYTAESPTRMFYVVETVEPGRITLRCRDDEHRTALSPQQVRLYLDLVPTQEAEHAE